MHIDHHETRPAERALVERRLDPLDVRNLQPPGEKGPADFFGHTCSGRAIFIECKDIKSSSLALGARGVKPHQWIALAELTKAGGIGLVIWAREEMVAVLDVDMIKSLTRGRKSISWVAIPGEWKTPFSEPGIMSLLERHQI